MSKYAQAFLFLTIFSIIPHAFSESLTVKLHTGELISLENYQLEIDASHQYITNSLPSNLNLNRPFKLILDNGFINFQIGFRQLIIALNNKTQLLNLNFESSEYRALYSKIVIDRLYHQLKALFGQHQSETLLSGMTVAIDADTGCNAVYANDVISLFKSTNECISSALAPTIIVHEIGHFIHDRLAKNVMAQDSDYKEAIADILAAIVFNTNIIGDGFFKTRLVSHLRDIEGVFNYAKNWRGTYSGSRILSSFYWELFNILKLNLPLELAQKTTLSLMFTVAEEITGNSNLHGNDMDEHMAFVLQKLPQYQWAQNAFLLAKIKSAIKKRFPAQLPNEILNEIKIDKIIYAPIGADIRLVGNVEQQYKNQKITIDFYGERKQILLERLPINIRFSLPIGRECGRLYTDDLKLISGDGVVIEQKRIEHIHMAITNQNIENQLILAKNFSSELPSFGLELSFRLRRSEIIENLIIRVDTDHPYPNDLVFQFLGLNNSVLGGLIGVDEDQLPPVNLGAIGALNRLNVNAQDVSPGHYQTWLKIFANFDRLKLECR